MPLIDFTTVVVFLGLIACEEIPKGSRPKEINPIKMQPPVTIAFHAYDIIFEKNGGMAKKKYYTR